MNIKTLLTDDNAVSPVIGVILMVAITVILAAVIGTFVLGLGENVQQTAPQASFNFDYSNGSADATTNPGNDSMLISHSGGDTVPGSEIYISVTGAKSGSGATTSGIASSDDQWSEIAGASDVTAGESIEITDTDGTPTSGGPAWKGITGGSNNANRINLASATIRVTWQSTNGDSSATLGKWDGPEA